MSREHPTVMVVDDQELFRVGIKQLLGERGIRVIGDAGRGAQAVRQACELEAVRAAARGESMISPRVANRLIRRLREPSEADPDFAGAELTRREHEVLELLARGMSNPEIAGALYLSEHTVKNYVSSLLAKLQVENRIQAAVRAVRTGMV